MQLHADDAELFSLQIDFLFVLLPSINPKRSFMDVLHYSSCARLPPGAELIRTDPNQNNLNMFTFVGIPNLAGGIIWQDLTGMGRKEDEGIVISFNLSGKVSHRRARDLIAEVATANNLAFIKYVGNNFWKLDLDAAKAFFKNDEFTNVDWAWSSITCEAEIEHNNFSGRETTHLSFHFTKQDLIQMINKMIFLSHAGVNKPMVRAVCQLLITLGFQPWLDEDAMQAGANLERALFDGMKHSCAAVFFVTPEFKDKNYLATEVEYAIQQKREKEDRFAIVTMILKDKDGNEGSPPDLLRQYVWRTPTTDIEMLNEIVKALPIKPSGITWK